MKRTLVFGVIVGLALSPFGAAWATSLYLTGPASVNVGDPVTEQLWVTQTQADPTTGAFLGIGDFEVGITFSGASFVGYSLGSALGTPISASPDSTTGAWDLFGGVNTAGVLDLAELSLLSPSDLLALQQNSPTLLLATLTFQCSGPGASVFSIGFDSLGLLTLGDAYGNDLSPFDTAGNTVDQVGTQPVPEPGTLLLLGSGLAGILGAARRRRIVR